jgi:hypothetical protein
VEKEAAKVEVVMVEEDLEEGMEGEAAVVVMVEATVEAQVGATVAEERVVVEMATRKLGSE